MSDHLQALKDRLTQNALFDFPEPIREEVAAWKRKVDRDELLFEKEMWSGNGYRLFHPDRPMPEGTRIVVLKPTPGEGERNTKPGAEAETLQARPEPALGGDERETAERN